VAAQFERPVAAAAKAAIDFEQFTARLKPGPFKTNSDWATTKSWVNLTRRAEEFNVVVTLSDF
jgi:hypothetical protein